METNVYRVQQKNLAKTTMRTMKRLKTTRKQMDATIHSRSTAGRCCSIPASAITVGSVVIATENSVDVYSCTAIQLMCELRRDY